MPHGGIAAFTRSAAFQATLALRGSVHIANSPRLAKVLKMTAGKRHMLLTRTLSWKMRRAVAELSKSLQAPKGKATVQAVANDSFHGDVHRATQYLLELLMMQVWGEIR